MNDLYGEKYDYYPDFNIVFDFYLDFDGNIFDTPWDRGAYRLAD